jgi:hypothetical protein
MHTPTAAEWAGIIGNRLLYSQYYRALYVVLIAMNCGVLLVLLVYSEHTGLVLALDVAITLMLALEIAARGMAQGRGFWRHASNIFDMFVLACCGSTVVINMHRPSLPERIEAVLAEIVIVLRYSSQLLRLAVFVKNLKSTAPSDIKFDDCQASQCSSPSNGSTTPHVDSQQCEVRGLKLDMAFLQPMRFGGAMTENQSLLHSPKSPTSPTMMVQALLPHHGGAELGPPEV